MRKFRIAMVALLVLIAATACQPRIIWIPVGDGSETNAPTVSTSEELQDALANGESVVLPSGTLQLNAEDLENASKINITGTNGSVLEIAVDSAETSVNDGAIVLPAGSTLKDVRIELKNQSSTRALSANGDGETTTTPQPPFGMRIQGSTTLDGVTLVFPADGSLSGINIYNANGTVNLYDITVEGNPQRAPINITKSTVNFSGTFSYEEGGSCGWYGPLFAIQVNGHNGDINEASNLSFSNVSGIDMIFQEYVIDDIANFTAEMASSSINTPAGENQTKINDFDRNYFFVATPDTESTTDAPTFENAGWIWFSKEYSDMILPLYFTAPAHQRFFTALNGEISGEYGYFNTTNVKGTYANNTISYNDVELKAYAYNNMDDHLGGLQLPQELMAVLNSRATGKISIEFTVAEEGENQYKATAWKISGDDVVLTALGTVYVVADFNISGTFGTASNVSAPENGPIFTMAEDGTTVTSVNKEAKFYVGGATGTATLNEIPCNNASELATDDCKELLELAGTLLPAMSATETNLTR